MSNTCETCRFWSELIASAIPGKGIEAMCLSKDGPNKNLMTKESDHCQSWADSSYGAIDDPSGRWRLYDDEYIQSQ